MARAQRMKKQLSRISTSLSEREFIGLIGHTGSGKSTLIQHMNGLLKATWENCISTTRMSMRQNTKKEISGIMSGSYSSTPSSTAQTVLDDVCFGPLNQGLSEDEAWEKAIRALDIFRIDEKLYSEALTELSEGQKRKVAIAGVLAMEPKIVVLDEPTAGLDPQGRKELLEPLKKMNEEKNTTIVLVSHNMEDIAEYAHRVIVIDHGRILYDDAPQKVFMHKKELEENGLQPTEAVYLLHDLGEKDSKRNYDDAAAITIDDAIEEIYDAFSREASR